MARTFTLSSLFGVDRPVLGGMLLPPLLGSPRSTMSVFDIADRVVDGIREELRRRIGPTFSAAELAELYGRGTDWCQQVALDVAPSVSDPQTLADAAFWLYLRGATDFAGGRQLPV